MIKLNIKRSEEIVSYDVSNEKDTLLSILLTLKKEQDQTLSFRHGCRSGVCGSCAVRVNGVERLACKTKISDRDLIEPLKNSKVIKDLIIDIEYEKQKLKNSNTYLENKSDEEISIKDEKAIDTQSNCILCQSCYSSCPVFEVNENFLGPYALTRVLRYVNDKKEKDIKSKIDVIQTNGIWDCTLCGNCTMVCPQHIDPKMDIMNLRNKSAQFGYMDPNFSSMSGGLDFNSNQGFGFNPNGF